MQFIVGQQLHRALEMLPQRLHGEVRSGMLAGADRIQRLLERDPVEPLAAVGQEPLEQLRDTLLALELFGLGAIADVAVHAHRVADILALHDQSETVRQGADDRVQGRGRHLQTLQRLLRPGGQGGRVGLAQGNRLLPAEPAVRGHRLTRAARQHDPGDGVIEVEILARHPVHVRDRDLLDARQILVRRAQPVQRQRLRPHRGELGDVVALELRRAAFLELGRLDEFRRDALARDARQYRAHLALERLGVISGGKGEHRVGKGCLRQRIKRELRGHCLALGYQAVQIEAPAAEHVREHLQRGEVGSARTGSAQRNHERAAGPVGVQREGGGSHRAQAHLRLGRQSLRRDVPEQQFHLAQGRHRVEVPGDHQDGVVGRVPGVVEALQHARAGLLERGSGTERIVGVGGACEHAGAQLLEQHVGRLGQVLRDLLLDRAAFMAPFPR